MTQPYCDVFEELFEGSLPKDVARKACIHMLSCDVCAKELVRAWVMSTLADLQQSDKQVPIDVSAGVNSTLEKLRSLGIFSKTLPTPSVTSTDKSLPPTPTIPEAIFAGGEDDDDDDDDDTPLAPLPNHNDDT